MNIVGLRKVWYSISGIAVVLSIVVFGIWGLKLGVEFTGGTVAEYHTAQVDTAKAADAVKTVGIEGATVVTTDGGFLLRMPEIDAEKHAALTAEVKKQFTDAVEVRFEAVGPSIGQELRGKAIWAVVLTLLLICAYVAYAFRKVTGRIAAWKYGVVVVLMGLHDAIIPVGVFAVLGRFYGVEVSGAFLAAILTILGYSINDTIVVFDRIRENLLKTQGTVSEIVDISIKQTIARSVNTSVTVVLALLAIFIFGGDSTKTFALALMLGVIAGTYSSIFVAAPLLVDWQKKSR